MFGSRHRICLSAVAILSTFCSAFAFSANTPHVLVTNDDPSGILPESASFYTIAGGGAITYQQKTLTGGSGIGGGYFGLNRIGVLSTADSQCIFASEAG